VFAKRVFAKIVNPPPDGVEVAEPLGPRRSRAAPHNQGGTIMKATELLEKQHRKVKTLLGKLVKGDGNAAAILEEVASDLAAHMVIEQEIFYPAALGAKEDLVLEGYEEHAAAEDALKRLLKTDPADVTFKAKATVLKELILHHVEEEEEELFPAAEKKLGAEKLTELCTAMKSLFDEMIEGGMKPAMVRAHKTVSEKGAHKAEEASP
jgi:hypothetical protein